MSASIEKKLGHLGLVLPEPLEVPKEVRLPFERVRLSGI